MRQKFSPIDNIELIFCNKLLRFLRYEQKVSNNPDYIVHRISYVAENLVI